MTGDITEQNRERERERGRERKYAPKSSHSPRRHPTHTTLLPLCAASYLILPLVSTVGSHLHCVCTENKEK